MADIDYRYQVYMDTTDDGDLDDPLDDITEYVKSVNIRLGVQDYLNSRVASVGSCSLVLDNSTKRFSPDSAVSRLYWEIRLFAPVRVDVTNGAATWTLFNGRLKSIQIDPGITGTWEATYECEDLLGVLQSHLLSLPVQENATSDSLIKKILAESFRGSKAACEAHFAGNPQNGETLTINDVTYQFKTALTSAPNEVAIGATYRDTMENLKAAINSEGQAGVNYSAGTSRPSSVRAVLLPSYHNIVLRDNAIRFYRLNDTSGATAEDSGLNKLNGTLVNSPTLRQGAPDYTVQLDGSSSYLSAPSISLAATSFSFEMWFLLKALSGTQSLVAYDGASEDFLVQIDAASKRIAVTSGANSLYSPDSSLNIGAWYHLAFVYDKSLATAYIYLNGSLAASGPFTDSAISAGTLNMGRNFSGAEYFDGRLTRIAVYKTALSASSISAHFSAKEGFLYDNAVLADSPNRYYKLNETSGTTAVDSGSDLQNGAYNGTFSFLIPGPKQLSEDLGMTFNGTNQRVDIPTFDLKDRSFSFEAWFYPSGGTGYPCILSATSGGSSGERAALIYDAANGRVLFEFLDPTPVNAATSNGSVVVGNRYHAVGVYDSLSKTASIYLNGILHSSITTNGFTSSTYPTTQIAAFNYTNYFYGTIDDVALYYTALSSGTVYEHYIAKTERYEGLQLLAVSSGTWGNSIAVYGYLTDAALNRNFLFGGTDGSYSADIESSSFQVSLAGDRWDSGRTNALAAIEDVCNTEYGSMLWCARNGTIVFRNKSFIFKQAAATPAALSTQSVHSDAHIEMSVDNIINVVEVKVTPPATLTSGVIARADSTIDVPGTGLSDNKLGDKPYPGWPDSEYSDATEPIKTKEVTLKYVDLGTGKLSGAKSLTLPLEPYTDYTVSDQEETDGFDYTDTSPRYYKISVAEEGSGVRLTFRNWALGTLYFKNLQVRGVGIVRYNEQAVEKRDDASVVAYGVRKHGLSLPLEASSAFAEAVADYLLARYGGPVTRINDLAYRGFEHGIPVFQLEIGDTITVNDDVSGLINQKLLITGMEYQLSHGFPMQGQTTLHVYRLDDAAYWILEDSVYGLLGATTGLSV